MGLTDEDIEAIEALAARDLSGAVKVITEPWRWPDHSPMPYLDWWGWLTPWRHRWVRQARRHLWEWRLDRAGRR